MEFFEAADAAIARGEIYLDAKRLVELTAAYMGAPTDTTKRWTFRQLRTLMLAKIESITDGMARLQDGILTIRDRELIGSVILDARQTLGQEA